MMARERLYLDASKKFVLREGEGGAFLLAAKGHEVPTEYAEQVGKMEVGVEDKMAQRPEDKMVHEAPNKESGRIVEPQAKRQVGVRKFKGA